jgi:hypothetical protein
VRLLDGSGMSGDVHVPFCEGLRVRFPWSTLLPKRITRSKTRLRLGTDAVDPDISRRRLARQYPGNGSYGLCVANWCSRSCGQVIKTTAM